MDAPARRGAFWAIDMRAIFAVGICFLVWGLVDAGESTDAPKLVGIWKIVKGEVNKGAKVEFTDDGKWKMTKKIKGVKYGNVGTYKVAKDQIEITSEAGGEKQVRTSVIVKWTNKVLILREKDKEVELRRVKKGAAR